LFSFSISLISSLLSPSRPAVSIRIRSYFFSSVSYCLIILIGSFSFLSMKAGSFAFFAICSSWSIAAGRWVSSPRSATFLPRFE